MTELRKRIFEIIQPNNGDSVLGRAFDLMITLLILFGVVIAFAVTFDLPPAAAAGLSFAERVVSVLFTVEYLLRILTADFLYPKKGPVASRVKYILSPMAVIDLVAILPFWLPMVLPCSMLSLRTLRLARLLRVFKLNRYFDALRDIVDVLCAKRWELISSLVFVLALMLVSSLLMYAVEHEAQPEVFRNAFSGLWWAVATLTTVGYGDIYPVTVPGRVLGALIAFSGIAFLAIPTGIVTSGLTERLSRYYRNFDGEMHRRREREEKRDRALQELTDLVKQLARNQGTRKDTAEDDNR